MTDDRRFPESPTDFGETIGAPNGVKQAAGSQSMLVFRSPTLIRTFGNVTFVIVLLVVACSIVLGFIKIMAAGIQTVILATLVIIGLGFGSIGLYILLRTGRIVLNANSLVEYNILGFSRTFLYAQIFEVKQGSHANEIQINYYPIGRNGQIDQKSVRGASLISVERDGDLFRELSRWISAHPPARSRSEKLIFSLYLLVLFLIAGFSIVLFVLAPAGLGH